jgi:hypothetical protein
MKLKLTAVAGVLKALRQVDSEPVLIVLAKVNLKHSAQTQ